MAAGPGRGGRADRPLAAMADAAALLATATTPHAAVVATSAYCRIEGE